MQNDNPETALRELAKAYRRRVSRCQEFDANVCVWEVKAERPWELIPVTGSPFYLETQVKNHDGQVVHGMTNGEYFGLFFHADLEIDLLSINRPNRVFYGPDITSGNVRLGEKRYPIFTKSGSLSVAQRLLTNSRVLRDLLEHTKLQADESVHFTKSGLSIYLHYRSVDFLRRTLDLGTELICEMRTDGRSPDPEQLPERFRLLNPLIERWAASDDDAREGFIESADRSELLDLIAAVDPYMAKINAYLDSFGDQPLSSSAIKLGQLAEATDEARRHVARHENSSRKRR